MLLLELNHMESLVGSPVGRDFGLDVDAWKKKFISKTILLLFASDLQTFLLP